MNFFGGRGKRDAGGDAAAPEKTDLLSGDAHASYDDAGSSSFAASSPGVPPAGGAAASPEVLQRAVLQEQCVSTVHTPVVRPSRRQKALVQQVIAKLTEVAFDHCVDKPDSALSARQRTCIHTVVGKYLDTSEFVIGRATKQQQPR